MNRATLILPLVAALTPACVSGEAGDGGKEISVDVSPADSGKFDSLAGKQIRFHDAVTATPFLSNGVFTSLQDDQSVTVNVATDDVAVLSETLWWFQRMKTVEDNTWPTDRILKLSTEPRYFGYGGSGAGGSGAGTGSGSIATQVLFLLFDTATQKTIACGTSKLNTFQNVAIDPVAGELHADNAKTFTFAQCGITAKYPDSYPSLALVALPWTTTGSLEGTYGYHVNATLE